MSYFDFWKQDYRLDKMNLKDLFIAYFMHYSIQVYLSLAIISAGIGVYLAMEYQTSLGLAAASIAAVLVIYPLAWYMLHRYVLHGHLLYKSPYTAAIWKRIHFDHHRDPHDLKVLFGALHTTLPTIVVVSAPAGFIIAGPAGGALSLATGLIMTCCYEFFHCIQHLGYSPKSQMIRRIKRLHLQHHFHDENTNFGITNYVPDKIFGTFSQECLDKPQSETVFNLGYTKDQVQKYPWVARLSDDIDEQDAIVNGVDRRKPKRGPKRGSKGQKKQMSQSDMASTESANKAA